MFFDLYFDPKPVAKIVKIWKFFRTYPELIPTTTRDSPANTGFIGVRLCGKVLELVRRISPGENRYIYSLGAPLANLKSVETIQFS